MHKLAIFASGAGSNAQKIIDYFHRGDGKGLATVAMIVGNKKEAGVFKIAEKEKIPSLLIDRERLMKGDGYLSELNKYGIDFMVLAGFLWKVPSMLIAAYPRRIVNIHPALLPLYGGKGMYGDYVHKAVIEAGEIESGITIHYVDEHYDHGDVIYQAKCPVLGTDTSDSLAIRIHELEHRHYPRVIGEIVSSLPTP